MCPEYWLEPKILPGYRVSRSSIQLTEEGKRHGCLEPQLGKNERGELAYWVKPIGQPAAIRIRIEGLKNFFRESTPPPDRGESGKI